MLSPELFGYIGDYVLWWLIVLSLFFHTGCFFKLIEKNRRPKMRIIGGNLLIFCCMLSVTALIGETYFRFLCVETDSFGVSLPARKWFALNTRLNSLGCRDEEWSRQKPAGVYRIAFIGDSFTYGWGIERIEDRFPDRIEAMYHKKNGANAENRSNADSVARSDESHLALGQAVAPKHAASFLVDDISEIRTRTAPQVKILVPPEHRVEVLNVAMPGWGTGDQLQPLKDMISAYGVDAVVLCYVPNDIEKLIPRTSEFDPVRPPEMTWVNPSTSALLEYLFHRIVVPRMTTVVGYHDWLAKGFENDTVWQKHKKQLFEMAQVCGEHGVPFHVVLLPFIQTSGTKYVAAKLHGTLHKILTTHGVAVTDMLPAIADQDPVSLVVSRFDAHPNERAHAMLADRMWARIFASGE